MRRISLFFQNQSATIRFTRKIFFIIIIFALLYNVVLVPLSVRWSSNSFSERSPKIIHEQFVSIEESIYSPSPGVSSPDVSSPGVSSPDVSSPDESTPEISRPACVFPKLEVNDPEIMKFFKKYPRLQCAEDTDWLTIVDGMFVISEAARNKHPNIVCDVYPIVKLSDFETKELAPIKAVENGSRIDTDFYRVYCKSSSGSEYKNYLAGIHSNKAVQERPAGPTDKGLGLDVIMLGLDSTSRQAYPRHLPRTRDYFINVLNGTEMEGYNILGDGTPAAIMPILLGHIEEELHEARRGYRGAKSVDDFPWIWNQFRDAGYVTAWAEDDAHLGTFQYRLLGFNNQPTDHYFRYFCVAAEPHYHEFLPHCQGSTPRPSVVLNYTSQLFAMYPQRRRWVFSFQSQLSHEDNNDLSKMDDDLFDHLQRMHREKRFDNAIFIMLADHGGRFSSVRATAQGKQEERLPYFGVRLPEWFHTKYPDISRNIKTNSHRLTTPFDVHETLLDILNFRGTGLADISKRGVSMFQEIPIKRDCDSARVDPHWCSCLDWKEENTSSELISRAVSTIESTFNNYTAAYRDLCAILKVDKVISAASFKVKDAVLKFKNTNDGGRGRFGTMTDNTKQSNILYQVTLTTTPGGGRFEATVNYDIQKNEFTLEAKDISRTNKYGNSMKCVEQRDAFLRPYCYCKDLLVS